VTEHEHELRDQPFPWWRQAKVTRWDQGIGLGLLVTALALQPVLLGMSWSDAWMAAVCWSLVVLALGEIRRRLSREDRES
jgi:hypothetical protein